MRFALQASTRVLMALHDDKTYPDLNPNCDPTKPREDPECQGRMEAASNLADTVAAERLSRAQAYMNSLGIDGKKINKSLAIANVFWAGGWHQNTQACCLP